MISIQQLSVSYSEDKKILDDLSIDLPLKKIHGLVGLNGSGKTTFIKTLFGLHKADQGVLCYNEKKLTKKDIAYLPTENYFYNNITGNEYLGLFQEDIKEINLWNELFQLPLNELIDGYSTGMKKKLAISGILHQDKPIIILDEPFNGLDLESSRIIRMILLKLKEQGKTIIITSHILESLTSLCDYIHQLDNKKILVSKSKDEFEGFQKAIHQRIEKENSQIINKLF
ncbi:ATP-binding cassette domain-containing protein [Flammeovirga sp. SubArs3]|uniref:ABC transporter ATP-binding protein n=1 Tax=Flammeovirga sp. SubArs3 TaxID=2995316 RepID=UPI00248AD870|nr:ATP-binding cassette domain-containing protein [Flammeovirga sp. SubArs3]